MQIRHLVDALDQQVLVPDPVETLQEFMISNFIPQSVGEMLAVNLDDRVTGRWFDSIFFFRDEATKDLWFHMNESRLTSS